MAGSLLKFFWTASVSLAFMSAPEIRGPVDHQRDETCAL